eukprot:g6443.t1
MMVTAIQNTAVRNAGKLFICIEAVNLFHLCSIDIASSSIIVWEGYMAAQQPAYLFKTAINIDPYSSVRNEQLTTGMYSLCDVQCRCCCSPLGWRYISAERSDQKYKEGCSLLKQELLTRVNINKETNTCTAITPYGRRVSDIPPPPPRRR